MKIKDRGEISMSDEEALRRNASAYKAQLMIFGVWVVFVIVAITIVLVVNQA